jgi:hypothetical protein
MKTSGWKENERRRQAARQASLVALLEAAASRLRRAVMPLERSGAAWLNGQLERVSRGGKCVFLALFILGAGGYSAYLVARGMARTAGTAGSAYGLLSVTATQPAIIHQEKDRGQAFGPAMDGEPYLEIHRFTLYIDSLKNSIRGKRIYDSLRMSRPGLMDSLRLVENLYQSRIKKR